MIFFTARDSVADGERRGYHGFWNGEKSSQMKCIEIDGKVDVILSHCDCKLTISESDLSETHLPELSNVIGKTVFFSGEEALDKQEGKGIDHEAVHCVCS